MTAAILRVVGPPGSGKTLLIVSLTEALRSRGHRVATVVRRPIAGGPLRDGAATLIVLSNGGRVTIEQPLTLDRLQAVIPSIDPSVDIILAEGYDTPTDATFPAIALAPHDAAHSASGAWGDAIATVASEAIAATFARLGPGAIEAGETAGPADLVDLAKLVNLVEQRVLGLPPREATPAAAGRVPSRWRDVLGRLWGRAARG